MPEKSDGLLDIRGLPSRRAQLMREIAADGSDLGPAFRGPDDVAVGGRLYLGQVTVILHAFQLQADVSSQIDKRLDAALLWLIRNRLTGQRFLEWFHHEQGASILTALKSLLNRVDWTEDTKPLIADR